jgi:hypothetical protein
MQALTEIDIYNTATILGEDDFALSGEGVYVPLRFKSDTSFILRRVLTGEEMFSSTVLRHDYWDEWSQVYRSPNTHFDGVFSALRFTLDALGSTLIQPKGKGSDKQNYYQRNPDYQIVDARG